MTQEAYVLLYIESEEGIPISRIPFFCHDEESEKSYVISARARSFFYSNDEIHHYNDGVTIGYCDVDSTEWRRTSPRKFFEYFNELSKIQKKRFWELINNDEPSCALSEILTDLKRFDRPSLNRALVLIHFEDSDPCALDSSLTEYLTCFTDLAGADKRIYKRISVGGEEVVADYLLTRFLEDKQYPVTQDQDQDKDQDQDQDQKEHSYLNVFDGPDDLSKIKARGFTSGDFSYNETFEHLDPYDYDFDDYGCEKYLRDDFYYRFNHDLIDSFREDLRIPYQIDQILTSECRAALPSVLFDHVLSHIDSIKREVFGMKSKPRASSIDF